MNHGSQLEAHLGNKLQQYRNLKQSSFFFLSMLARANMVSTCGEPAGYQGWSCVCLWVCSLLSLGQLINYRGPWKGGIRPATAMASINTHLNDTLEVNSYFCAQPRMHTHEGWQLNMRNEHEMSSVTSGHFVYLLSQEDCTLAVLC